VEGKIEGWIALVKSSPPDRSYLLALIPPPSHPPGQRRKLERGFLRRSPWDLFIDLHDGVQILPLEK
jgi:hypothetical protein